MNNIEFKFIINKQANHYFFVQNLSEWHFSCRPKYNKLWLEKVGPLSKEEKFSLDDFKKTRLKYHDSKSIFEKSFFLTKNPYKNLKKELSQKEVDSVMSTMNIFEGKFKKIYNEDLKFLRKWKEILSREANSSSRNQEIVNTLGMFYKAPLTQNKIINCFLLINPTISIGGGGANVDDKSITCEISHRPMNRIGQIQGTLWHETIHLLFDKVFLRPFMAEYFENDMQKVFIYKELIASSLFPRGISGNAFFKQTLTKNLYGRLKVSEDQTMHIIHLTEEYLKNSQKIDNKYLEKMGVILKK